MHECMKSIHKENTLKRHLEDAPISSLKEIISDFFEIAGCESLEKVIARMASVDGIPFQMFCTSEDIRKGLLARGFGDIPRSPNTIRRQT